jgi:hypothetical protein
MTMSSTIFWDELLYNLVEVLQEPVAVSLQGKCLTQSQLVYCTAFHLTQNEQVHCPGGRSEFLICIPALVNDKCLLFLYVLEMGTVSKCALRFDKVNCA